MSLKKSMIAIVAAAAFSSPVYAANIVETASSAGSFNTLLAAAQAAGLADALATGENLTVFAPTDEAFAALPEGTVENLLKPENKEQLAAILSYHVLPGKVMAADISSGLNKVHTLKQTGDQTVDIFKNGSGVKVDGAQVISADIEASNGVIHVINKVILPSS
ncbi:fasciclin domain-containing protein [Kiloniella sp. b19]|uniref:fasciclin domain-containing protein n=1 Tax=Kiloniella sp. GXU_MW_B19 TaxID=3141326 RepID=UPI0031D8674D